MHNDILEPQVAGTGTEITFEDVAKTGFTPVSLTPKTKTVHLYYQSCCGCGCGDPEQITRTVPEDSDIEPGSTVHDYVIGDREGWV